MFSRPRRGLLSGLLVFISLLAGCKDGDGAPDAGVDCTEACVVQPFDVGGEGVAAPLSVPSGQARAGRAEAADLPTTNSGLETYEPGDFILANARVAMIIEDVDASDLYDPYGGKPVGIARVANGALSDIGDFGEFLITPIADQTIMAEHVGVIADGTDGNAAIVRAEGPAARMPFIQAIVGPVFLDDPTGTRMAIDYVLEPDADWVDIYVQAIGPTQCSSGPKVALRGFMYTDRLRTFRSNGNGFANGSDVVDWLGFVDEFGAVSLAYEAPGGPLTHIVTESGFVGKFGPRVRLDGCSDVQPQHFARMFIAGPDADALVEVVARSHGQTLHVITGTLRDAEGTGVAGAHVHALRADDGNYVTRARTDATGAFTVHVPVGVDVALSGYLRGYPIAGPTTVTAATNTQDLAFGPTGTIHIDPVEDQNGLEIPAKVQIIAHGATTVPPLPARGGEDEPGSSRFDIRYLLAGESADIRVPYGEYRVITSRGFRYEIAGDAVPADVITIDAATPTVAVAPVLTEVIDAPSVFCADFHIHTRRSNDAPDDPVLKLRAAAAEGLEIPVRSEHEYVEDWDDVVLGELDSGAFMIGLGSVEMTTMESYGHFGVFPLDEDPEKPNGGTPLWQEFPTVASPTTELRTLTPSELFASVRARPEDPMLIVNHPRGGTNYFSYAGFDSSTGVVDSPMRWDDSFDAIEVFNSADWTSMRNGTVRDWLWFLTQGIPMVAVGSSDTHALSGSPIGYARTCVDFSDTTYPTLPLLPAARRDFADVLRDEVMAGHAAVNGGIFVEATVDNQGPGSLVDVGGAIATVNVRVQAASWVDVDTLEVVYWDGVAVQTDTYTIGMGGDCAPTTGAVRCDASFMVPVPAANGFVVVAAYGDMPLSPVAPGRGAFGVTNAIRLVP